MRNLQETSCVCEVCIKMCATRPCWGTPNEALKIIEAGFGNRLMNDYWVGGRYDDNDMDIELLCPASVGYEAARAGSEIRFVGRCTFLTPEGFCELHVLGLKPIEGRLAIHGMSLRESGTNHQMAAMAWNDEEGQRLVEEWWKDNNLNKELKKE